MHKGRTQHSSHGLLRLGLFHHVVIHYSLLLHELHASSSCTVPSFRNEFGRLSLQHTSTYLAVRSNRS
jgi:hypothetical protein